MIYRLTTIFLITTALSACATMSPEKAASWDTQMLCDTLSISRKFTTLENNPNAGMIIDELNNRELFSQDEMDSIIEGSLYIGMSQSAMYCAWGLPQDQNTSTGSWGIHVQHVYEGSAYVYTENGVVNSWQN